MMRGKDGFLPIGTACICLMAGYILGRVDAVDAAVKSKQEKKRKC